MEDFMSSIRIGFVAPVAWTLALVLCAFMYPQLRNRRARRRLEQLHGCQPVSRFPHRDPLMGSDLHQLRMEATKKGFLMKLYEEQFNLYGKTFEENFLGKKLINSMDTANIQTITALAFDHYGKDASRNAAAAPFIGPSIVTVHGPPWKRARSLVKTAFTRAEVSDVHQLSLFADRFMNLIPSDGSEINMQPLLHKLFLDVATDFLFGKSTDLLQSETPAASNNFLQSFEKATAWVGKRRAAGWLRFRYAFNKEWVSSYSAVHAFIDQQVARALNDRGPASSKSTSEPDESLSHPRRVVLLDEMAKQIHNPTELRYQILGVFLPARDITSTLIGNALFHLARNPTWWTKLRETSPSTAHEALTFEKLKSFLDFRYVLHETFRLQGPAGRVYRVALRDTVLPTGGGANGKSPILITKGTMIAMNIWCVHHDPDLWGPDVHVFRPERWVGRKPLWDFIPFLGGPRICPAQQQVLTQATYLLVRLTQRFARIENRDPVLEYVELAKMGFESRNGVKVAFYET